MHKGQMKAMEGGTAEMSYAAQSSIQRGMWAQVAPVLLKCIKESSIDLLRICGQKVQVADFGCSSSLNAILQMCSVTEVLQQCYAALQASSGTNSLGGDTLQIMSHFSDLPSNDFNTLFHFLPPPFVSSSQPSQDSVGRDRDAKGSISSVVDCDQILSDIMADSEKLSNRKYFAAGVPGSFYNQLFPTDSIHIAMSSTALHFLSKVPDALTSGKIVNKGLIRPPPSAVGGPVREAYQAQAHEDLCTFLEKRGKELVSGGLLWMFMLGEAPTPFPDFMSEAMQALVEEGKLSQDVLDNLNLPIYDRRPEDIQAAVDSVGGVFHVKQLEHRELPTLSEIARQPELKAEQTARMQLAVILPTVREAIGEEKSEAFLSKMLEQACLHSDKFLARRPSVLAVVLQRT
eukprot:jgi/Mesen1/7990/ME000425S07184